MLRSFLRLYFKSKLKNIFSYICLVISLAFVIVVIINQFDIHPFAYIIIGMGYVLFLFLYLEVKERRICIILDTKSNQQKYNDETGLEACGKRNLKGPDATMNTAKKYCLIC